VANQAIALQARAPQSNFLGGAVQQNAQLINMMSQQRAAERQAAVAQQEMELARAAEGRAVTAEERAARKAQQEYTVGRVAYFRDQLPSVKDDVSWNNWLGRVGREDPEYADELRRASGGRYDADFVNRVSMDAKTFIDKTIATPVASFQVGKDLKTYSATVGGTQPGVTPLMVGGASDAAQPPMAEAPATGGVNARATQGTATAPSDLMQQGVDPRSIPMGNPLRPVSMTTGPQMGGQPDLAAVVQGMMSSGQISQANLQLMRDTAGPANDAQLAEILRANNIRIVPDDEASMRSAVFRPGEDAAPQMQQVQATNAPGTQFRVAKDPMQSPLPGSVLVPTPVIREQKGAETQGSEGVKIVTQPKIAGGTKSAELQAQRDFDYPDATGRFETNLARLDSMLGEIDRLQKHDAYTRIIGPLDAFTPNFGRARGAQAIYNTLISMGTQEELQAMRRGNETGGAVGNVSDADIKLLERGFGALDQSQMEQDFDASVKVLVNRIRAARDRLIKGYRETYSYRLPKNWAAPAGPRRTSTKGAKKVGGFTVLEEGD
jgi:hypothetical protein